LLQRRLGQDLFSFEFYGFFFAAGLEQFMLRVSTISVVILLEGYLAGKRTSVLKMLVLFSKVTKLGW